jgi:hypothetical protein
MTSYLSGRPLNYTADEFVKVYTYERTLQDAYDFWLSARSLEIPAPLVSTLPNGTTFTVEVLTYIATVKETLDLVKVTTDKQGDAPAYFISQFYGLRGIAPRIAEFSEVKAANNLITFKTKSGEFLYFNISAMSDAYADIANVG